MYRKRSTYFASTGHHENTTWDSRLSCVTRPADRFPVARRNARDVAAAMGELRKLVPSPGSYVSESNYFEADWQGAFWGTNYRRLRQVKDKVDPEGLFFVHHGVGSEDWSADGFTRLK